MSINCNQAIERLLEADPAELRGQGNSELAVHVRACARCRAVGTKLLEGQAQLAVALNELRPGTSVERALSETRARRARARTWQRAWQWGPVVAAAAMAAMLILQSLDGSRMTERQVVMAPAIEPLVEMTVDQNVLVFETKDRSARVIWFY